jgi:hypothetical protein
MPFKVVGPRIVIAAKETQDQQAEAASVGGLFYLLWLLKRFGNVSPRRGRTWSTLCRKRFTPDEAMTTLQSGRVCSFEVKSIR